MSAPDAMMMRSFAWISSTMLLCAPLACAHEPTAAGPAAGSSTSDGPPDTDAQAPDPEAESAAVVGQAGTYVINSQAFAAEPTDCRVGETPRWTWELSEPEQGRWTLLERAQSDGGSRESEYTCEGDGIAFTCLLQTGFDYAKIGQDAAVSLVVAYKGQWDGTQALSADFDLTFSCEGTACAEVAESWTVAEFPCTNTGSLTGTRQ